MDKIKIDKGKTIPHFKSDEEMEHFIDTADLSEYDLSVFKPMRFEIRDKDARVNMRMPQSMLNSLRIAAAEEGMPYQRFTRDLLEKGLERRAAEKAGKRSPRKHAS